MPDLDAVVACLPEESPAIGADTLVRAAPVVEQVHEPGTGPRFAVETTYQGTLRLDEAALNDASTLAGPVGALGRWVASVLVRLGDLELAYLPPEPAVERRQALIGPHRAAVGRSTALRAARRSAPAGAGRPGDGRRCAR